jgi:hypothetical protein
MSRSAALIELSEKERGDISRDGAIVMRAAGRHSNARRSP